MWYQKSVKSVLKEFKTDLSTGLSPKEASYRLSLHGPNILPTKKKPLLIFKFFAQFKDVLILLLLIATLVSYLLGEKLDAIVILAIVLLNSTIGFIQEIQAQKTLDSLRKKEVQESLVLRNGTVEKIPVENIVPGDVLILEEGEKIPADARVIEAFSLRVDESILTGESMPVSKHTNTIEKPIPLADRTSMIYKDTKIISGRGKAVVTETGSKTEVGQIAQYLEGVEGIKTPLSLELEKVGRTLTLVILIIASIVFFLNTAAEVPLIQSLLVSISLSVAAIPEGLPAIVTIVLSLGVKRLADKKTLVKKLPAVETLGAIKIIATDKTGTLTQNKINVVKVVLPDGTAFKVEGDGYYPKGNFFNDKNIIIDPSKYKELELLLRASVLSSNASLKLAETWEIIGDTTEGALIVGAARANCNLDEIKKAEPKVYEIPFSSERKMSSVVVKVNDTGDHLLYAKGAPEVILGKCKMGKENREEILQLAQKMSKEGLRTLALAQKKVNAKEVKKALEQDLLSEDNLTYLGLVGMQDPLRAEVIEALSSARQAGIRTIMITGDHKETAASIAQQAGIIEKGNSVFTEEDINLLTKEDLAIKIKRGTSVFARISPMGKLKIVEAIKSLPHTLVAVTGDGVNDTPALISAHIGVAMGKTGTDIAREVADMVITDDNYATIVDAVKEGRTIFANLVKFIRYLISCNLSEVILISAGVILGTPIPLIPIQILWINLITDGLPALALGMDPPEFDVMKRPPRDLSEGILHKKRWIYMMIEGSIMGISTFLLFVIALNYFSYPIAQTMAFAALSFSQLVHAFNNRSTKKSLFQIGIFSNAYLVLAIVFSVLLQILTIQTSFGNIIFKTQPLNLTHWIILSMVACIPLLVVEIKKMFRGYHVLP